MRDLLRLFGRAVYWPGMGEAILFAILGGWVAAMCYGSGVIG